VGYVFQNFNLFPHLNVLQNIIEAPLAHKKLSKDQAILKANQLLGLVGLRDKVEAWPKQLSGGSSVLRLLELWHWTPK
jgi:polar amino acid transport system ATP-binding protein